MAKALMPELTTNILPLIVFLLLTLHFEHVASSFIDDRIQDNESIDEDYTLDDPAVFKTSHDVRTSRFLSSSKPKKKIVKVGMSCNVKSKKTNACNGVWANNKKSRLYCCSKRCADVLNDQYNCGRCGQKCRYGQKCCNGVCRNVWFDKNNCGRCNRKCRNRHVRCEYGYCGYA